jgi:hypothetical protein
VPSSLPKLLGARALGRYSETPKLRYIFNPFHAPSWMKYVDERWQWSCSRSGFVRLATAPAFTDALIVWRGKRSRFPTSPLFLGRLHEVTRFIQYPRSGLYSRQCHTSLPVNPTGLFISRSLSCPADGPPFSPWQGGRIASMSLDNPLAVSIILRKRPIRIFRLDLSRVFYIFNILFIHLSPPCCMTYLDVT